MMAQPHFDIASVTYYLGTPLASSCMGRDCARRAAAGAGGWRPQPDGPAAAHARCGAADERVRCCGTGRRCPNQTRTSERHLNYERQLRDTGTLPESI